MIGLSSLKTRKSLCQKQRRYPPAVSGTHHQLARLPGFLAHHRPILEIPAKFEVRESGIRTQQPNVEIEDLGVTISLGSNRCNGLIKITFNFGSSGPRTG